MEITARERTTGEIAARKKHLKFVYLSLLISIFAPVLLPLSALGAGDTVLVIRIQGKDFEQALQGIRQEADGEILIEEMIINRKTDLREIKIRIKDTDPQMVILMDNISIKLFKKYQESLPSSKKTIPSLSIMASFTDIAIEGLKNATGIFYEVPIVTSIVSLRSIMPEVNIRKVGVIYRNFMEDSILTNRLYCRKENIDLIPCPLSDKEDITADLLKGLESLKNRIDALWVLNDSKLINAHLLLDAWLPFTKTFKKPIIAGVEVLVQPEFNFGTFGVIPDHRELGVQAAEMLLDIMEKNWQVDTGKVEQPRSVYKILNWDQAERMFQVNIDKLNLIDKVLR